MGHNEVARQSKYVHGEIQGLAPHLTHVYHAYIPAQIFDILLEVIKLTGSFIFVSILGVVSHIYG